MFSADEEDMTYCIAKEEQDMTHSEGTPSLWLRQGPVPSCRTPLLI